MQNGVVLILLRVSTPFRIGADNTLSDYSAT